jgi:formate C-acetyltransferase
MEDRIVEFQIKDKATPRTANLKKFIEDLMDAGVRKTTFYPLIAESLAKTLGEPQQIRRAKAFARLLDNVEPEVLPYELLGGSILGMWPLDPDVPGYDEQYQQAKNAIEDFISGKQKKSSNGISFEAQAGKSRPGRFALMARDHYNANIDYSRLQSVTAQLKKEYENSEKITPQQIAQVLEWTFQYDYGEEEMALIDGLPWISANHVHLNYEMIINDGYGKLRRRVEEKLAAAQDPAKREFYEAALISVEAAILYITKYAAAFEDAAGREEDTIRARELAEIGKILKKTATEKADNFREAMQLMWITHIIANTGLGSALSFARFDQYMYPFYKNDITAGAITDEEVRELLCCMMLKVNEPKMRTVQSVILGGLTPDGKDASNELTRLFLEASRRVKLPYPNIAVRVAEGITPEWVYNESIKTIKEGFGMPMLVNDDIWVKNFMALGYSKEQARDYYNMGCVEMLIQNKGAGWMTLQNRVIYPHLLKNLLDRYKNGEVQFNAFEDLVEAFLDAVRKKVRGLKVDKDYVFPNFRGCDAFGSLFIDGCLESGKDMFRGGSELPAHVAINGMGLATAAESLMAIKAMVFDQKSLTLNELIRATENNFKDNEGLRQRILSSVRHYGNDDEVIDRLAAKIFETCTNEVYKLNDGTIPQKYVSSYFGYTNHVATGEVTPATPDGRLAGEPLSDGLGPSQGRDVEGPTKFFNTMLKLNYAFLNGALATNIKINPNLFSTKGGTIALKNLLKAYLENGGPQVQINFVTQEDLIDAQINPQKHRDLVVRIAGFCEYFIYLDINQQNEVIMRTEHAS